jgi:hypothetical protein
MLELIWFQISSEWELSYLNQIFLLYHSLNCSTFGNELNQYLQTQFLRDATNGPCD